jgi:hypothetical protein
MKRIKKTPKVETFSDGSRIYTDSKGKSSATNSKPAPGLKPLGGDRYLYTNMDGQTREVKVMDSGANYKTFAPDGPDTRPLTLGARKGLKVKIPLEVLLDLSYVERDTLNKIGKAQKNGDIVVDILDLLDYSSRREGRYQDYLIQATKNEVSLKRRLLAVESERDSLAFELDALVFKTKIAKIKTELER